jgi:hypothetical protein
MQSGIEIRRRNIEIGYTFEKSIIELEKIKKLRDHFNTTRNKIKRNIEKKIEIHQKKKNKESKNQIKKDNKIEEPP